MQRWKATIIYRSNSTLVSKDVFLEEIEDLHDVVEQGYHFDTIDEILITRYKPCYVGLTIEEAQEL